MSVGILLLCHGAIGDELLAAVRTVMGPASLRAQAVSLDMSADALAFAAAAAKALRALDEGQGVLVLTDLYGSTTSNVAENLRHEGVRYQRVSGLNLPMLLRVFNYADQELDDLARTAASGGRSGVVEGHA
jgi:PTS system ascorbate-specific IIA component